MITTFYSFFLVLQLHPLLGYELLLLVLGLNGGLPRGRIQRATLFALAIDITSARCQSCDNARSCRTKLNQRIRMARAQKTILCHLL